MIISFLHFHFILLFYLTRCGFFDRALERLMLAYDLGWLALWRKCAQVLAVLLVCLASINVNLYNELFE